MKNTDFVSCSGKLTQHMAADEPCRPDKEDSHSCD
jgi:hypothetical protein